jgi:hypothetical protein
METQHLDIEPNDAFRERYESSPRYKRFFLEAAKIRLADELNLGKPLHLSSLAVKGDVVNLMSDSYCWPYSKVKVPLSDFERIVGELGFKVVLKKR